MGMQEYIVSKKYHKIEDFVSIIGIENITCVTIPKKDIKGTTPVNSEFKIMGKPLKGIDVEMNKDEEYVVLYGDRHDLKDLLNEHFSDEVFFGAECANIIALGSYFPSRDEMNEVFRDILIEDYLREN